MKYILSIIAILSFTSCTGPNFNEEDDVLAINKTMDQWHNAASQADLETYFNTIHEQGFFLGTDASENWDKTTFYNFSKPHFEKAPAWSFTAHSRNIYFSKDGKTAWFNELLDTWMDTCRGSGVMLRTSGGWKIMQYNLAILVPNEKVQDYLKVLADTTK